MFNLKLFTILAIFIEFSLSSPLGDETTTEFGLPQTTSRNNFEVSTEFEQNLSTDSPDYSQNFEGNLNEENFEEKSSKSGENLSKSGANLPKSEEKTSSLNDDETPHILIGKTFKFSFSISGIFTEEFLNKNSPTFKSLRDQIDSELREIIKQDSHIELLPGTFRLVNILPSKFENFLFVTILMESENEEIAEEWKNAIENQILMYNKFNLSEIQVKLHGDLSFEEVGEKERKNLEENGEKCESDFCIPISSFLASFSTSSPPPFPQPQKCSPNEEIQRGKTSIFIFENQNCVDHIKNRFAPQKPSKCSVTQNEVRDFSAENEIHRENEEYSENADEDPMTAEASEHSQQFVMPEEENDEQIVVVVRKKGNKVFIEI